MCLTITPAGERKAKQGLLLTIWINAAGTTGVNNNKVRSNHMKRRLSILLFLGSLLLVLAACAAQKGLQTPESIDPYTFDPSQNKSGEAYSAQAYTAYQKGDYEKAAKYYLAHLQTHADDNVSWYNLACSFGLLGKPEQAAKYLMQSYKAGYRDLDHIKADTDFTKVKSEPVFVAAMDSLQTWSDRRAFYQGEQKYLSTGVLMPYRLHLPNNYDPKKSYTLLIGLHGFGDKAQNFSQLWRYFEKEQVIFAVPEAPYPFTEGEIGFSWNPFVEETDPQYMQGFSLLQGYVLGLQKELSGSYNIGQTWLLGFSQGAFNGYILALKNPAKFAGLLACGGGLMEQVLTDQEFEAARNLKIVISHGKQDPIVPFENAEKAMMTLGDKEFPNVWLDEFEGGHVVSPSVFKQWLQWLQE